MRGFLRNARLGLVVVVLVLCLRTVILVLNASDDGYLHDSDHKEAKSQKSAKNSEIHQILSKYSCKTNITRPQGQQIHRRHTYWQLHDTDTIRNELLIYSAFYDDRHDVGHLPVIRLLGVANREHVPFYCQIWYNELKVPYIVPAEETKNGRGDHFNKVNYGQYMYTCKLLSTFLVPNFVSMTTQRCNMATTYLPIVKSERRPWSKEFAICVPISFGKMDPKPMVEWMELVQLLGVSTVHIYNATISSDLNKLFSYYRNKGLLQVHPMPPAVEAFDIRGAKLGSPASLNDCMLRNMNKYRYLIFIDFDEVIVPKANQNYSSMLKDIQKHHKLKEDWMSYTFRNVYYFLDFPTDKNEKDYHTILKYRSRLDPSGYLYAAKSFINPRKCLSVFNHYCYIRFPSAGKHWTIDVDTNIATSHHYRKCNFGKSKCEAMVKNKKPDDIMLRYKKKLHELTDAVLKHIT